MVNVTLFELNIGAKELDPCLILTNFISKVQTSILILLLEASFPRVPGGRCTTSLLQCLARAACTPLSKKKEETAMRSVTGMAVAILVFLI